DAYGPAAAGPGAQPADATQGPAIDASPGGAAPDTAVPGTVVPGGPLRPPAGEPAGPGPERVPAAGTGPRVALIIDDWGYDWEAADAFLRFPEPLTVAVLPFLPRSADHARKAEAAGFEVILHMPMEAQDATIDIGPGGIYAAMADEDIAAAVRSALAAVPGARGLNN